MEPVASAQIRIGVRRAIEKLSSLHDGDQGVSEVVGIGAEAIPALRAVLFERERSGLFHTRVRAVDALVALHAYDVLADFLRLSRPVSDPVERLGEEAVINAAARGIARSREEWAFQLLLELGKRLPLAGVIAALGSFGRRESIPILIVALEEDEARMSAENALSAIGRPALPALIDAAISRVPSVPRESESSLRRRRSALAVLIEIGLPTRLWPRLRDLIHENDVQISLLACKLCIDCAGTTARRAAVDRLWHLRGEASWLEQMQIDRYLAEADGERAEDT